MINVMVPFEKNILESKLSESHCDGGPSMKGFWAYEKVHE